MALFRKKCSFPLRFVGYSKAIAYLSNVIALKTLPFRLRQGLFLHMDMGKANEFVSVLLRDLECGLYSLILICLVPRSSAIASLHDTAEIFKGHSPFDYLPSIMTMAQHCFLRTLATTLACCKQDHPFEIQANYSQGHALSFSPRVCEFKSTATSNWLNNKVYSMRGCVTFKCFEIRKNLDNKHLEHS